MFVIGSSHAINVLREYCTDFQVDHTNWDDDKSNKLFRSYPVRTHKGTSTKEISCFLIRPNLKWNAFPVMENGRRIIRCHEEFIRLIREIPDDDITPIVSFIGGNEHSVLSLIQDPNPYDFFDPTSDTQSFVEGYQIIPTEIVQAQIERQLLQTVSFLQVIRSERRRNPIFHVSPPPPIGSESQILLSREPAFEKLIANLGITPISVRLKYYNVARSILQRHLKNLSIELVLPPITSLNKDGSLSNEFAYGNTHANTRYGAMVAEQLSKFRVE